VVAAARRLPLLALVALAALLALLAGASAAAPAGPVTFAAGLAVVEAENPDVRVARSGDDWLTGQSPSGFVGAAVRALPDNGSAAGANVTTTMPELAYRVSFPAAGTYYLWLRMNAPDGAGNSLLTGVDGALGASYLSTGTSNSWNWLGGRFDGARNTVTVPSAGEHTVHLWMREDGLSVDRLLLASSSSYTPSGTGPAVTPRDAGEPAPDTTPPTLTGRQPAAGATGIAAGADVAATFSEAMAPASVTGGAFTLAPSAAGPAVAAAVTASPENTVFTLNPSADLAPATEYTATVATGATDAAGNPLAAPQTWSFTTAATPPPPPPPSGLVAVDIAPQAGLRDTTETQGENCILDFDGDGVRDVFISTHGIGWRLMRGRPDGTFVEVERFPATDRHGCAIGDFGGISPSGAYTGPDGRPDIYATIGACQGTCSTPFPNELWLQRPDGRYLPPGQNQLEGPVPSGNKANAGSVAARAFGVADDHGRGREPLGFDIDADGLTDLFVGNEESEMYTSASLLFHAEPNGGMSVISSSSVVQEVGSLASTAVDIDGDGRLDLVNVATSRLYVFRNTPSGFQDVTSAWRLPTSGDMKDIEFADLNGDGRLDALMANHTSFKVRLNRDGRFPTEDYARSLTQGRDLAVGDADGDGDLDVYMVVGQNETYDDLLLRNGGRALSTGKWDFTTIPIPQAGAGEGDTAQALPGWDGTNRAAFLVNNGKWDGRGPRQLIFMMPT
jgi:hypothetical protein